MKYYSPNLKRNRIKQFMTQSSNLLTIATVFVLFLPYRFKIYLHQEQEMLNPSRQEQTTFWYLLTPRITMVTHWFLLTFTNGTSLQECSPLQHGNLQTIRVQKQQLYLRWRELFIWQWLIIIILFKLLISLSKSLINIYDLGNNLNLFNELHFLKCKFNHTDFKLSKAF